MQAKPNDRALTPWRTIGKMQASLQTTFGGFCIIQASAIYGTEAGGTLRWTANWAASISEVYANPFRMAWRHYPLPGYDSVTDMLYDVLLELQQKLWKAEQERLRLGYGTLKAMYLAEQQKVLKGVT